MMRSKDKEYVKINFQIIHLKKKLKYKKMENVIVDL